jgi:hypothetical protein
MHHFDAESREPPSFHLRFQEVEPAPHTISRGRGVAEGVLPGFSDQRWKVDHAWHIDPAPITWQIAWNDPADPPSS